MKNLKKVLALVLVVATLMSFATVASATFTDADKVEYTEAVDVMSMINVINGYTDGSFRPEGNVTRAQMAKMVAYIVAGGEDVGPLYAGANTFSDCTTHWAKGYIAYANKTGIVAGVGNGKFNPEGSVTGTQAAKMMLCALGYDAALEGYTGTNWSVNVLSDARDAGLLKGLTGVDMSKAMTREQAAQLMFNALKADMVKYSNKGTEVDLGNGVVIRPTGSDAEKIENTDTDYTQNNGKYDKDTSTDKYLQLCEKYFEDLRLSVTVAGAERPSNKWSYKGGASVTAAKEADYTYVGSVTGGDLYKDLGTVDTVNAYRNGDSFTVDASKIAKNNKDEIYKAGDVVDVYLVGKVAYAYSNPYYLAQVTKINDKDSDNLVATLTTELSIRLSNNGQIDEEEGFAISALAEEDYVLVTLNKNTGNTYDVASVQAVEPITGKMSAYKANDGVLETITFEGTKYNAALSSSFSGFSNIGNFDTTYNLFLDPNGYAVGITVEDEALGDTDYVYVNKVIVEADKWDAEGAAPSAQAKVTYMDGTTGVVDLNVTKTGSKYYAAGNEVNGDNDALVTSLNGSFCQFAKNTEGAFKTLKQAASTAKVEFTKEGSMINVAGTNKPADSKTVLTTIVDGKATTYTGYKSFPNAKFSTSTEAGYDKVDAILVLTKNNVVTNVFVMGGSATVDTTYAFYLGAGDKNSDGQWQRFWVEGKEVSYLYDTNLAENGVYTLDVDGDTLVTATPVTPVVTKGEVEAVGETYFTVGGVSYAMEADAAVYDMTGDEPTTTTLSKWDIVIAVRPAADKPIDTIYVVG